MSERVSEGVAGEPTRQRRDGMRSRARILDCAGRLFAAHGYEGVSTRRIATAAEVNVAAISYHFGGKDGLYRGVLTEIVKDTAPILGALAETLTVRVASAGGDRSRLASAASEFINGLLQRVLGDTRMRWRMALVLREFQQPSRHFPVLLNGRINPLHDAVAGLVAAATGGEPSALETTVRTHAFVGQLMSFGAARTVLWARLGWDGYTTDRVAAVAEAVVPHALGSIGLRVSEKET